MDRPHVTLKLATSLDGRIATAAGDSVHCQPPAFAATNRRYEIWLVPRAPVNERQGPLPRRAQSALDAAAVFVGGRQQRHGVGGA